MVATLTAEDRRDREGSAIDIVARYAAAKSRRDVDAALALCTDDFVLDTVAFGIRGIGAETVASQLHVFFATFPDYRVTLAGQATAEETVAAWGTVHATMRGPLGSFAPTGRGSRVGVFAGGGRVSTR